MPFGGAPQIRNGGKTPGMAEGIASAKELGILMVDFPEALYED
jgi:hypothetical protein